MDSEQREQWADGVRRMILERPGSAVTVIISTGQSIEVINNFENVCLQMGMFDIAKMMTATKFQQATVLAEQSGEKAAMESEMDRVMQGKKVWGN